MEAVVSGLADTEGWLELASGLSELFGLNLREDPGFLSSLTSHLAAGKALCVKRGDVAEGEIVGGLLFSREGSRYEIDWLGVGESARGQGAGRSLVTALESLIVPPAQLTVITFAPGDRGYEQAHGFYSAAGMKPSKIIEGNYPHGDRVQEFIKLYE